MFDWLRTLGNKKRIWLVFGSDSDFKHCIGGFEFLEEMSRLGYIAEPLVWVSSIHRNTLFTLFLQTLVKIMSYFNCLRVHAEILVAGAANHLSGTAWAFSRNTLRDNSTGIFGVGISHPTNQEKTDAARLSMTQVPSIPQDILFYGDNAFERACHAAFDRLFGPQYEFELPAKRKWQKFTLTRALQLGCEKQKS